MSVYESMFQTTFENAHDASADTIALLRLTLEPIHVDVPFYDVIGQYSDTVQESHDRSIKKKSTDEEEKKSCVIGIQREDILEYLRNLHMPEDLCRQLSTNLPVATTPIHTKRKSSLLSVQPMKKKTKKNQLGF